MAIELIRVMCKHLSDPIHRTNMLFSEWERLFEQVSTYQINQLPSLQKWASDAGIVTQDAACILFAIHSYYSLVVKIVTSELLSLYSDGLASVCERITASRTVEELYSVMSHIENSEYYRQLGVSNFLEGDFFSWYMEEPSERMAACIRAMAREFLQFEPASTILLPEIKQDLLKEFYSSLVDEQIRHDLGEYYTPDWLAQHLLNQVAYEGDLDTSVLDPACGSGTFLVEAIDRVRKVCDASNLSMQATLEVVVRNVRGMDLNPLAVISARANYILAIQDLILSLGDEVEVPVYLADSINVPVEKVSQDGQKCVVYSLDTTVGDFALELPSELVDSEHMGWILLRCEEAIQYGRAFDGFIRMLRIDRAIAPMLTDRVVQRLRRFYSTIESLEERDWDRIWCRIIKNNFSPRGFPKFDLIVGNPPWVRWSRLPAGYRNRAKEFCHHYGLVSGKGYSGGIESDISTVMTFSSADNWLRIGGRVAFLITWTVFKSASARGFRLGHLPGDVGLRVEHIEDLTGIQPFRDATNATGLYVARKVKGHTESQFRQIPCNIWKARDGKSRVPSSMPLGQVYSTCEISNGVASPIGDWGAPLFTGNMADFTKSKFLSGDSGYVSSSHRGTISDCARVYWIKVLRYSPETGRALIRTLSEEELPRARLVDPVQTWIEADLLFPLIRGRDVGRYSTATEGWFQIIPNRHYGEVNDEESFGIEYPLAYSYFTRYRDILTRRSSYRRYQRNLPFYVIFCVGKYSFMGHKVVWMEQQDPAKFRSSVLNMGGGVLPNATIVPDHKLYFTSVDSIVEAHYLCGFLNSRPVRKWLGGFLLGKQIGISVFEHMKVPMFNTANRWAREIAEVSRAAHIRRKGGKYTAELESEDEERLESYVERICAGDSH